MMIWRTVTKGRDGEVLDILEATTLHSILDQLKELTIQRGDIWSSITTSYGDTNGME